MLRNSSIKDTVKGLSTGQRIGIAALLPVWVFVSFMLVQVLIVALLLGMQSVGISFDMFNSAVVSFVTSAVIYVLTLLLVVGGPWLMLKKKTSLNEVGLQRSLSWKDLLIAPVGLVSYFFLTFALTTLSQYVLPFIDLDQKQDVGFEGLTQQYEFILAFVTLVIVAPIAEEVLFRGYLFGKLRKVIPVWGAVLITSALFGLVHFAWNVGIDTFALSIMLCLVTIWSKSLWPAIMIHMAKNFIAFYFLFLNPTFLTTIGG